MKAGLGLTYQQYEGMRYLLSHDFNDAQRSHIRRKLAGTGFLLEIFALELNRFLADHDFPTLPTIEAVQKWIKKEMALRGLEWNSTSARLDPAIMMKSMVDTTPNSAIDGHYHFQIIADGVSAYRNLSVCNVGIKLFNSTPTFNSLTSMKLLYVISFVIINFISNS